MPYGQPLNESMSTTYCMMCGTNHRKADTVMDERRIKEYITAATRETRRPTLARMATISKEDMGEVATEMEYWLFSEK